MVPCAMFDDERLDGKCLLVYGALACFANKQTKYARPSISRIAKRAKLSPTSVKRALKVLAATGWVEVTARFDDAGDRAANGYHLRLEVGSQWTDRSGHSDTTGGSSVSYEPESFEPESMEPELSPAATTSNSTPRSLPKEAALASPKRETRAEKPRFDSKGFTDVWRQYAGADAVLTARCYRQAKEVVTEFGLERVSEWIARYFKRSDWWFAKNGERSFGAFYTHLEAIANAGRQRKAATGPLIPLCPNCGANGAYPAGGDFRECIECHTRFEDKSDA